MIYLSKDDFDNRALDIAIADLAKDCNPMYDGALDGRVKQARRQLVNAGFAWVFMDDWNVDECEMCFACQSEKTGDYHSGIEFKCGSFLAFNMDGTIKFSDKCSKEADKCES